ncbi:peptidoglycan recognition protein 1-like isoform X3 [Paramacrobiotus metropolitanus]|uniref:peptidoglycan recognition protein 1-like isoform X3 n=1 Tax=Paramacrobiotus metropolitanus TaxID=2943436 RepID=UPI0024458A85|nr:peptidoglycan recognition protein 1-like isoform X3 [Paramacrobiotus metropolitanus]
MNCPGVNITTRSDWGAPALNTTISFLLHPVRYMVYTDTKGDACAGFDMCREVVAAIREFHADTTSWTSQTAANFVPEIFYNFLIGMDGSVFEGRGWDRQADYHRDYNQQGIVTAFIEKIPTAGDGYRALTYAAAKAANNLLQCAQWMGYLNPGNDSVIVNIHPLAKNYILYPEAMQSLNDTPTLPSTLDKPSFSEGVAAGIAFSIILLVVLLLVLLSLLWPYIKNDWKKEIAVSHVHTESRNLPQYCTAWT